MGGVAFWGGLEVGVQEGIYFVDAFTIFMHLHGQITLWILKSHLFSVFLPLVAHDRFHCHTLVQTKILRHYMGPPQLKLSQVLRFCIRQPFLNNCFFYSIRNLTDSLNIIVILYPVLRRFFKRVNHSISQLHLPKVVYDGPSVPL